MYSFLLIDDHSIVRAGLKILIRQQFSIKKIDEAACGDDAYKLLKQNQYDIIIMDLNMPSSDPFEIIEYIKVVNPNANIIILTMNDEIIYAKRFYQTGVKGFLNKSFDENEILQAIIAITQGRIYMSESIKSFFASALSLEQSKNPFSALSNREFQILIQMLNGKSIQEIGDLFTLSPSTVSTYKAKIYNKLGLQNNNLISLHLLAKEWKIVSDER